MDAVTSAESSRSRRSLLRAGLAGLAGLALGALGRPRAAEAAPGTALIIGQANAAGTTNTSLTTDTDTGTAFLVTQNGTATALRGVAGSGIAGFFTSANGSGVSGVVGNNTKYGVYAANDAATTGTGAALRAAGKQNHGLVATSDHFSTHAVQAQNTEGGCAVIGISHPSSYALAGVSGAGEFFGSDGVVGFASEGGTGPSMSGVGVIGLAVESAGTGVEGISYSHSGATYGVVGSVLSDNGIAVYGSAITAGSIAVYSAGNAHVTGSLDVTGTLTKASGSFKIDHPLDPAGKYLYHSFVESPDMKNVYDGVVTLDVKGEATVELPDWFEALNRDLRYQLTALGKGAPELHVERELKKGQFTIGGGLAGQRVCWQLTGIRKDAFANAHRIPVEEAKPERERNRFLHPAELGEPAEKSVEAGRVRPPRRPSVTRPGA